MYAAISVNPSPPPSPDCRHPVRVIAITGCDGAGKSTLATELADRLRQAGPTELLYLGQSSGRIGEWLGGLPLIGTPIHRYLLRKSERVHNRPSQPPGTVTAAAIYLLSRWRTYKFQRMLAKCRRGVLVVTDRYPQAEMAGFRFDGPQLAKTAGGNWFVRRLRTHELQLYRWMAARIPLLVIRLNIDAETAHARKPDHKLAVLREKVAVIAQLSFNGARILDLDARERASAILEGSLRAVRAHLHDADPARTPLAI